MTNQQNPYRDYRFDTILKPEMSEWQCYLFGGRPDDKERERHTKAVLDAIERYTDERMAVDYVCEPADDSRSGGQRMVRRCSVCDRKTTSPVKTVMCCGKPMQ